MINALGGSYSDTTIYIAALLSHAASYGPALLQLSAHGTRNKLGGVRISEEARGVGNNLANVEVVASVDAIGQDASLERSGDAAGGDAAVIRCALRVGERNARWSCAALGCLVDVCCSQGHGLVRSSYAGESDVLVSC